MLRDDAIKTAYPGVAIRRTWKRDQTSNLMTVEAAVENLFRNVTTKEERNREVLKRDLFTGTLVETPFAFFRMDSLS